MPEPATVVDVGCRWGAESFWLKLPNIGVIGFDPDEVECRRLTELAGGAPVRYVPVALGAEAGPARLHLTEQPACSSLYPPDAGLIATRPSLSVITPVGETGIHLQRLDDWCAAEGVERVDYLKIDTQGSELGVLQGAGRILESVRVVEAEVEFNPIYEGQPLFGDVDAYLRKRGFVLWRLSQLAHYCLPNGLSDFPTNEIHYYDVTHPVQVTGTGGQLYWANAFYVRREMAFPPGPVRWETALRDAVLTGALGYWDLARTAAAGAVGAPEEAGRLLADFAGNSNPAA
jgi:FkbM family methyltransferase